MENVDRIVFKAHKKAVDKYVVAKIVGIVGLLVALSSFSFLAGFVVRGALDRQEQQQREEAAIIQVVDQPEIK